MSAFGLRFELMAAMCVRRHIMNDVSIKKITVTLAKAGNFKQEAQVTVIVATINIVVAFVTGECEIKVARPKLHETSPPPHLRFQCCMYVGPECNAVRNKKCFLRAGRVCRLQH